MIMEKHELNPLTTVLIALIVAAIILGGFYTAGMEEALHFLENTTEALFPLVTHLLELTGVGIICFGSAVILTWFVKAKLKDPYKPSGAAPFFARYLTLGLEFLIGAEIIKTSILRTWEEFSLLLLVIASRGLLGFINHLEGKWGRLEDDKSEV